MNCEFECSGCEKRIESAFRSRKCVDCVIKLTIERNTAVELLSKIADEFKCMDCEEDDEGTMQCDYSGCRTTMRYGDEQECEDCYDDFCEEHICDSGLCIDCEEKEEEEEDDDAMPCDHPGCKITMCCGDETMCDDCCDDFCDEHIYSFTYPNGKSTADLCAECYEEEAGRKPDSLERHKCDHSGCSTTVSWYDEHLVCDDCDKHLCEDHICTILSGPLGPKQSLCARCFEDETGAPPLYLSDKPQVDRDKEISQLKEKIVRLEKEQEKEIKKNIVQEKLRNIRKLFNDDDYLWAFYGVPAAEFNWKDLAGIVGLVMRKGFNVDKLFVEADESKFKKGDKVWVHAIRFGNNDEDLGFTVGLRGTIHEVVPPDQHGESGQEFEVEIHPDDRTRAGHKDVKRWYVYLADIRERVEKE